MTKLLLRRVTPATALAVSVALVMLAAERKGQGGTAHATLQWQPAPLRTALNEHFAFDPRGATPDGCRTVYAVTHDAGSSVSDRGISVPVGGGTFAQPSVVSSNVNRTDCGLGATAASDTTTPAPKSLSEKCLLWHGHPAR